MQSENMLMLGAVDLRCHACHTTRHVDGDSLLKRIELLAREGVDNA